MDSPDKILDGGAASEPSPHAETQLGMAAAVQFPFLEDDLAFQLGFPAEKIRAVRKTMTAGIHFVRVARAFRWSEEGLTFALDALRLPPVRPESENPADTTIARENPAPAKPAPVAPPSTFTITNMNIPNQRLLLCRDAAGEGAKVWIHPEWRALFKVGMVIEATRGTSGDWRTRKPRSMGRF